MTDELKPLIVEGEKVGDYNDTCYAYDKWCMATVEPWESPKEFDAYQYDWETFCEFYTLIRCCSHNFFSYSTILSDSKLKCLLSWH